MNEEHQRELNRLRIEAMEAIEARTSLYASSQAWQWLADRAAELLSRGDPRVTSLRSLDDWEREA
ncbi:MAG TPA: hypothetical protein PLJ22_07700, partial [Kiritimatiellia bacterium]|nr:hypothetical protein [Kiritimatiellia bacterium]